MDEKRKDARVRANVVVSFKVKTTRLAGGSRIKDISASGLCLPSKHHFPVDSILEIEIRSEDLSEPLKVLARVVRITNTQKRKYQFEVGLQYIDLPSVQRNLLHHFIQSALASGVSHDISWID